MDRIDLVGRQLHAELMEHLGCLVRVEGQLVHPDLQDGPLRPPAREGKADCEA